jgi:hypothetical protein
MRTVSAARIAGAAVMTLLIGFPALADHNLLNGA